MTGTKVQPLSKSIPTPRPLPVLGNLFELFKSPKRCVYDTFDTLADKYGDLYKLSLGGKQWYILSDWHLVQEVLLKQRHTFQKGSTLKEMTIMARNQKGITDSDGSEWVALRKVLTPLFDKDYVYNFMPRIQSRCYELDKVISTGNVFNALEHCNKIAFALVSEYFFAHRIPHLAENATDPLLENQKILTRELLKRIQLGPFWRHLPTVGRFQAHLAVKENFRHLENIVSEQLSLPESNMAKKLNENGLSVSSIANQLYGLVGAGFESTGSLLHWALYSAAQNPAEARKVRDEVKDFFQSGNWDAEAIESLPHLHNFVREVMRLYPPFPMLIREAAETTHLSGNEIPKGSNVVGMLGRCMRSEKAWGKDPHAFHPDRHDTQNNEMTKRMNAYGTGPRVCVGEPLADLEIKTIVGFFLSRYDFTLKEGQNIYPKLKFSWNSNNGIFMRAH